jgi:methylmalonyl-CoA/ethylmalonyl-CoA epimerase
LAKIKRIDHVALVIQDMEEALAFWRDCLGIEISELVDNPTEKAEIGFLPVGESEIELVRPTSEETGLAKHLARKGPGMHHICLEVDDIEGMLKLLEESGVRLIDERPKLSRDGTRYAFIHPKASHGVLVELYQKPD